MGLDIEISEVFRDNVPDPVVYNPVGGESVSVDGIVDRDSYQQERTSNGLSLMKTVDLYIQGSDISEPEPDGDTVTFDDLEWGVSGFQSFDGGVVYKVSVMRKEPIKKKARR